MPCHKKAAQGALVHCDRRRSLPRLADPVRKELRHAQISRGAIVDRVIAVACLLRSELEGVV